MTAADRRERHLWSPLRAAAMTALFIIYAGIEGGAIHV